MKIKKSRNILAELEDKTVFVTGKIAKFGVSRTRNKQVTCMLVNVVIEKNNKKYYVDHIWMKLDSKFRDKDLYTGDVIQFYGTIYSYIKPTINGIVYSYGIGNIRRLQIIEYTCSAKPFSIVESFAKII